ncbi:MAG TPA: hypothetical protein VMN37_03240 [Gemmatimonadales bacterium]|nr:hypothetical protein [Gemmatimonadales bacterium]
MTTVRVGLGLAGIIVAGIAVALGNTRIGWGAIALLAASMIVRLLGRRAGSGRSDGPV